jgi:hypothetical protein
MCKHRKIKAYTEVNVLIRRANRPVRNPPLRHCLTHPAIQYIAPATPYDDKLDASYTLTHVPMDDLTDNPVPGSASPPDTEAAVPMDDITDNPVPGSASPPVTEATGWRDYSVN